MFVRSSFLVVLLLATGLMILALACSDESNVVSLTGSNAFLILPFPRDTLFIEVDRILVKVTAPDMTSPVSAQYIVDHSESYAVIGMTVPPGPNRTFAAYAVDSLGDSLFWATVTATIVPDHRNDVAAMLVPLAQSLVIYLPHPTERFFDQVTEIAVQVTGADIAIPMVVSQMVSHENDASVVAMAVPGGAQRHIRVYGRDQLGQILYVARKVTLVADTVQTRVTLALRQSGFATARRVAIFRNLLALPMNVASVDSVLISLGFTRGNDDGQFEVFPSSFMGRVILEPGRDLVILEGWQDTGFYADYMRARSHFEGFVDSGGCMLVIANEGGTHGWYYDSTGMQFPAGVLFVDELREVNRLLVNGHMLTAGLEDTLRGNKISHGGLTNLPTGSLVLTENDHHHATLVIFPFGQGTVVISTQNLEWLYHYRYTYNSGSLLPRIVRCVLGFDPTPNP